MEYRRLGSSGLKVSVLSLGAMTFGESKTFMKGVTSTDDQARRVFDASLGGWGELVDTANVYGRMAERKDGGAWIKRKRGPGSCGHQVSISLR